MNDVGVKQAHTYIHIGIHTIKTYIQRLVTHFCYWPASIFTERPRERKHIVVIRFRRDLREQKKQEEDEEIEDVMHACVR